MKTINSLLKKLINIYLYSGIFTFKNNTPWDNLFGVITPSGLKLAIIFANFSAIDLENVEKSMSEKNR